MDQSDNLNKIIHPSGPRRRRIILAGLGVIAITVGLFFGIRALISDQDGGVGTPEFGEITVEQGPFTTTMAVSGVAAAATSSQLAFPLNGQISEVLVEIGDEVSRGQILARLDDRDVSTQVSTAEVNLAQANLILYQMQEPARATTLAAAKQTTAAARSQLTSAQLSLEQLTNPATLSELAAAAKAVFQATSTLAKLETPASSAQVTAADAAVIKAESTVNSSIRQIDTTLANLRNAHGIYCDWFTEARRPVDLCWKTAVPLSSEKLSSLSESIAMPINPPTRIFELTIALIQADATYKNALDTKINSQSVLDTALAERAVLSEPPAQHELDQAIASLQSAKANQDALLLEPTIKELEQATAAILSAEAGLNSALAKESELQAGPWPTDMQLQEKAISLAEIALKKAENSLKDLELTAPFAGIIGAINVSIGDRVNQSTPILVLNDPTSTQVHLTISETDLSGLTPGQLGIAQFDAMPGEFYVLEITNITTIPTITQGIVTYPVHAKILKGPDLIRNRVRLTEIISTIGTSLGFTTLPNADSSGRSTGRGESSSTSPEDMLECVKRVIGRTPTSLSDITPEEQERIRQECLDRDSAAGKGFPTSDPAMDQDMPAIGMNANVIIAIEIRENVLYIPSDAIHRVGRQSYVFVPSDSSDPDERMVVVGETNGSRTEIVSGLDAGDTVVLETTPAINQSTTSTDDSIRQFRQVQ